MVRERTFYRRVWERPTLWLGMAKLEYGVQLMKKNMSLIVAGIVAATAIPAAASAQSTSGISGYGSVGYSYHDMDDVNLGTIQGRLGARFNPYLGVEGEIGLGVKRDDVSVGDLDGKAKLKHTAAIYGVGFLPISPNADLYARVGYGTSEGKVTIPGDVIKVDGDSWNYGVGGQYFFDGQNGVRADYTRYDYRDDAGNADVWSVGYVRKF